MPPAEELTSPPSSDQAAGGRRERRRQQVRDRLYETAMELFLEQGYERTTMDDIGNRADLARTTVFNHYPRKSAFLTEWGARRRAKIAAVLRESHLIDKPIDVILEHYMQLLAELNEEHRAETKELMQPSIAYDGALNNPPLATTLGDYIRRAQKRGQVRPDADPGQAGLMLAASYFVTIIGWCDRDPPPFDLADALLGTARLMLGGLQRPSLN
jgi:AcrR family transcriptional regulator